MIILWHTLNTDVHVQEEKQPWPSITLKIESGFHF